MLGSSPNGLSDYWVAQAVSKSRAADLARRQWSMPVGNAAVTVGLLSFYLGAVWTRTLPEGAGSSRIAAPLMVVLGLVSIIVGHRLRKDWKRRVDAVLAEIDTPPERTGPHLRPSSHQVNRRSWRRHAARCRVRGRAPEPDRRRTTF